MDARLSTGSDDIIDLVEINRRRRRADLKLSVLMPVHNEQATVGAAIADVLGMDLGHPFELIVVDDGSTDRTASVLGAVEDDRVIVHRHAANLGKGAAVLSAASLATGSHLVIFDADREYRAVDLVRLFQPIVDEVADVVFGVRMFGMNTVYQSYRYALGNRVTTLVANILFDACLSDLHSCLKMMPVELFRSLRLTKSNFGLDSEISAELLRRGFRPYEVPVSYVGRSHAEGKKLTWRDGFDCLVVLSQVRARGRRAGSPGSRPDLRLHDVNDEEVSAVSLIESAEARIDGRKQLERSALPS